MNLCDLRYSQALILLMFLRICTGWYDLFGTFPINPSSSDSTTSTSTMILIASTNNISSETSTYSSRDSATPSSTSIEYFTNIKKSSSTYSTNYNSNVTAVDFTDFPPIQGLGVAPDNKSLGIGLGVTLPIIALVLVAIFFYKRRRSLNDENASIGKTNVTKAQSNKKSVTKELVISKEIPKINRSRTPDNIYYNIEMADEAQKYNETSTEEYYNVVIERKEELKNHSTHQQHGTAETQYATLDIRGNSEHLYTGFNM